MKKNKMLTALLALITCMGLSAFAGCGHTHTYNATTTAPTCLTQGFTTHTCECGDSYVDTYVDALGHEFENYASNNDAKCGVNGTETATCERQGCAETDTRTDEDSALEHVFENYVSNNDATYMQDGTQTAVCERENCEQTHTITEPGTKLPSGIVFLTLQATNTNVYGKVSNSTEAFSFINEIESVGFASFFVSLDIYGLQQVATNTIPLEIGDNKVYVTELINDIPQNVYTVTIRRKPMYEITFTTNGGTEIQSQIIEEDSLLIAPTTTKVGYTFESWDYDLSKPITQDITLNASWTPNEDTAYTVEYYLQNLENDEYTLELTEHKTGITDTTVNADIKEFAHFTYVNSETDSGNINPDGSTILQVYYTRDIYTVTFNGAGGSLVDGEEIQTTKYGGSVIAPAYIRSGYTFDGYDYTEFTNVSENLTVTAKWQINQYTITIVYGNGMDNTTITQDYNSEITQTLPTNLTKIGYTFNGWDSALPSKMLAQDITITAKWNINQYTITFVYENGMKNTVIALDYNSVIIEVLPTGLTKEGYTFKGWDTTLPTMMPAENLTITAKWQINQYTITIVYGNGMENTTITQDYNSEITEVLPTNLTREGFQFGGWDIAMPNKMPSQDITITAIWQSPGSPEFTDPSSGDNGIFFPGQGSSYWE